MRVSKKKIKKTVTIGLCSVLVLGGCIGAKMLMENRNGKTDYYKTLTTALNADLGYFKYTYSVRSSDPEHKEVEVQGQDTLEALEGIESTESAEGTEKPDALKEDTPKNEWNNENNIKIDYAELKNYDITVTGNTTSLDPILSEYTIKIATPYKTGIFTTVHQEGDVISLNLQQMRTWFLESGEQYLFDMAAEIPSNVVYASYNKEDLLVTSGFAEISEETGVPLNLFTKRLKGWENIGISQFKGVFGKAGHTKNEGSATLILDTKETSKLIPKIKSLVTNWDTTYKSSVEVAKKNGLYDDKQYEQALQELDNSMIAMQPLNLYLATHTDIAKDLTITGQAKDYTNGAGNSSKEADLNANFTLEDVYYEVGFGVVRTGDKNTIYELSDSVTAGKDLKFNIVDTIWDMVDYFNPTCIPTKASTETGLANMKTNNLQTLCTLLNNSGKVDKYLTLVNIEDYIQEVVNKGEEPDLLKEYLRLHEYKREAIITDVIVDAIPQK